MNKRFLSLLFVCAILVLPTQDIKAMQETGATNASLCLDDTQINTLTEISIESIEYIKNFYKPRIKEFAERIEKKNREIDQACIERIRTLENSQLDATHIYQQKKTEFDRHRQEIEAQRCENLIEFENIKKEFNDAEKNFYKMMDEIVDNMIDDMIENDTDINDNNREVAPAPREHSVSSIDSKALLGIGFVTGGLYIIYNYGTEIYKKLARYCYLRNTTNTEPLTHDTASDNENNSHETQNNTQESGA